MALIGQTAAITFGTTVLIVQGQSKRSRSTTIAFRPFYVRLALALPVYTRRASRTGLVAFAPIGVRLGGAGYRAIVGRTSRRVPIVTRYTYFTFVTGGIVITVLK